MLANCQLPHLVVVDSHGQFVGLLPRHLVGEATPPASWVEHLIGDATTFPLEAPFAEVMEYLSQDDTDLPVVVLQSGRPTGIIYREGLAALGEEIHSGSFATETVSGTQTLRVPDPAVIDW